MFERNNLPEATRQLPVHPDLDQLKHQAKDLLRNICRGDVQALAEFRQFHPHADPANVKLSEAQFALARRAAIRTLAAMNQQLVKLVACTGMLGACSENGVCNYGGVASRRHETIQYSLRRDVAFKQMSCGRVSGIVKYKAIARATTVWNSRALTSLSEKLVKLWRDIAATREHQICFRGVVKLAQNFHRSCSERTDDFVVAGFALSDSQCE